MLLGAVVGVLVLTRLDVHPRGGYSVNLVPGTGIAGQLDNADRELGLLNVMGNVAMFVPVGLLAPLALRWSWRRVTLTCLLLSVLIEMGQAVTGRSGDVDDTLLDTLGGLLGALAGAAVAARLTARPSDAATPDARRPTPDAGRRTPDRLAQGALALADVTSARTGSPR